jgi:hypothetical protein
MKQLIVAEITRSWPEGKVTPLISEHFERVIEVNRLRGYRLRDWRFAHFVNMGILTETIIAVFELDRVSKITQRRRKA